MANITKEQVVEWLSSQTVLEISDLVKNLESKWGVTASSQVNNSAISSSENKSEEVEEKTEFDVILQSSGDKKISVIKEVRSITGLGLKESKELVEGAPKVVKKSVSKSEAENFKKRLEEAGAQAEIK